MTPEYIAIEALNQSRLKKLRESEKAFMATDSSETGSMKLGTLAHAMVLEPHRKVHVYPERRSGAKWEAFLSCYGDTDDLICIQSEHDKASGIVESLKTCRFLQDALPHSKAEVAHTWTDRRTGLQLKALMDLVNHSKRLIVDLKTARSIDKSKFESDAFRMGYHIQEDFYRRAFGYDYDFVFVVVKNSSPFDFGVFRLSDELREIAKTEVDILLDAAKITLSKPGGYEGMYPNNGVPIMLNVPNWAAVNMEDDEELELDWTTN